MSEPSKQGAIAKVIREKGQYAIAFLVIASLLVVANVPIFVVFFFGVFAYFVAKMLGTGGRTKTRSIFEFYLTAHEILREDLRRWYGFEVNEAIAKGDQILTEMHNAPTLVHFALGSLYHKVGDHAAAVKHLSYVSENPESFESAVVYPSPELRRYVSVLRKIEREPAEAPLTSAAVRSLERARKLKLDSLLEESLSLLAAREQLQIEPRAEADHRSVVNGSWAEDKFATNASNGKYPPNNEDPHTTRAPQLEHGAQAANGNPKIDPSRKPISEVLHDIYDGSPN